MSGRRKAEEEKQAKAKPGQGRPLLSQAQHRGKPWGQGLSTEQAQGRVPGGRVPRAGGESSLGHLLPRSGRLGHRCLVRT